MAAGDGVTGDDALQGGGTGLAGPDEEARRVGGVAGGVHDLDLRGDAVDGDDLTVDERLDVACAGGGVEGADRGAGELAEAVGAVGVVRVVVRQQDETHRLSLGTEDIEVPLILRARVDHDAVGVPLSTDHP